MQSKSTQLVLYYCRNQEIAKLTMGSNTSFSYFTQMVSLKIIANWKMSNQNFFKFRSQNRTRPLRTASGFSNQTGKIFWKHFCQTNGVEISGFFMPLRFYVKSILHKLKVLKLPVLLFWRLQIWLIW